MSREVAEEALIENRAWNNHSPSTGPINFYECNICHNFHLTSKGTPHPMLSDKKTLERIKRLKQGNDWGGRFR